MLLVRAAAAGMILMLSWEYWKGCVGDESGQGDGVMHCGKYCMTGYDWECDRMTAC